MAVLVAKPSAAQEVELELAWSVRVDESFPLTGVARAESGALLLWGSSTPRLLIYRGGERTEISAPAGSRPVAAAFASGDSVLEVVDAADGSISRLTSRGALMAREPVDAPMGMESAAHGRAGWYLGGRDAEGRYRLVLRRPSGEMTELYRGLAPEADTTRPAAGYLVAVGDSVILSSIRAPFTVIVVRANGERPTSFSSDAPLPVASDSTEPRWVSLSVLPIGGGYLRTFVDLRSDTRMIALYAPDGALKRARRTDVPLGFVGRVAGEQALIGVRRTDILEVVGYRWTDVSSTFTGREP